MKGRNRFWWIVLPVGVVATVGVPSSAFAQDVFHVSLQGSDSYSGTRATVDRKIKDGPVKSIQKAIEIVRSKRQKNQLSPQGAIILVQRGTYSLRAGLELKTADSGTVDAPLIIKAVDPERTILDGGRVISSWRKLPNSVAAFLPEASRGKVLQTSLRSLRIPNFKLFRRSMNSTTNKTVPELFFDGAPQTVARYPNTGWLRTPSNHDGTADGFKFSDAKPKSWNFDSEVWVQGFLKYDWADMLDRGTLDKGSERVRFAEAAEYGIAGNARYRFLNVLEELDTPGEYVVDAKRSLLYYYPTTPTVGRKATVSVVAEPLIRGNVVHSVHIEGFTIQNGQQAGIEFVDSTNIELTSNTIRNVGTNGISFVRVSQSTIADNDIERTGESGVRSTGGVRATLTSSENQILNNHIKSFGRITLTQKSGIVVHGVGQRVAFNKIEDGPSIGILLFGNDHVIENNHITNVCREVDDSGAIYIGRNPTFRGTIIRNNLIENVVARVTKPGTNQINGWIYGVYLDDAVSGNTVTGNIIRNSEQGLLLGGGRDNTITNNVFLGNRIDLQMDARAVETPNFFVTWGLQTMLNEVNYSQAPYSTKYPELATYLNDEWNYPKRNVFTNNVLTATGQQPFLFRHSTNTLVSPNGDPAITQANNYVGLNPGFMDPANGDYRPLPGSAAGQVGFTGTKTNDAGLQVTVGRPSLPPSGSNSN